jgi:hypothetical protein
MITNLTGNINNSIGSDGIYNTPINKAYPKVDTSFFRLSNFFKNKCEVQIEKYSSCLGNSSWKENITQYIPLEKRLECWSTWSIMKACSRKHLGDGFTLKLEISRQLQNTKTDSEIEAESISKYNDMMKNQFKFLKEDMPVAGEAEDEE